MSKLVYFILPAFFACSGTSTFHKKEYYYHPQFPEKLKSIDTLGVLSMENLSYELEKTCDSCHGASADFFSFEYHQKLDSLIGVNFPHITTVEMYPGLGRSHDSTILLTQQKIADDDFWKKDVLEEFHGVEQIELNSTLRLALSQIAAQYNLRYFLFPLKTNIIISPENKTSGKVSMEHTLVLFDGQNTQILFKLNTHLVHKTAGNEQIDRQTTPWLLLPMFETIQSDLENFPELLEKK